MALSDSLVTIAGTGSIYLAPVGTPKPVSLTDPDSPWVNIGHTSVDDTIAIARDGGDTNILGSWQNPTLRVQRDPVQYSVVMNLLQTSNETLEQYFGAGDKSVAGVFGVAPITVPLERAMFVRIIDGANEFPFFIPKVSLSSDDDIGVDVDKFMHYPIRATILSVTGSNLMEFYGSHLGLQVNEVQSIAITGTATSGTYTLSFGGQTTGAIQWNTTAAAVKTALVAMPNIDASDVSVTGGPHPGTPIVVTFTGKYEDTDVALMTATSSLIGTTPAVVITTTTPGGN
jgi:hypothetical protein